MLKSKIDVIFCDVISLLALEFIVSSKRGNKQVPMKKNWNFSMAQFLRYDCTFIEQYTITVTLTFDIWRSIYSGELTTAL